MGSTDVGSLPPFLELAGHPVRWGILTRLARSDQQVGELAAALQEPQSLVSYHLARLKDGGLVSSHRSSFDGRAAYYRVHLDRCRTMLDATGTLLHPGVGPTAPASSRRSRRRPVVLFACTGNGTRSQIAEALLRDLSGGTIDVVSGGSHPKPIHPNAVAVLAERGIDIGASTSKSLDVFVGRRFDMVVTLCDRVREVCPPFAPDDATVHWSIEDPSRVPGTRRATMPAFRDVADDLATRIHHLIPVLATGPDKERSRHA